VGGRKRIAFRCRDLKCRSIKVVHRAEIEVIMPDEEIVSYILLIPSNEKWYRIFANQHSDSPDNTTIYKLDIQTDSARGGEESVLSIPRFYPLQFNEDLKAFSQDLLKKLKNLVIFS
jgi:hypothetical protein